MNVIPSEVEESRSADTKLIPVCLDFARHDGPETSFQLPQYLPVDDPVKVIRPNDCWANEPPKQQRRVVLQRTRPGKCGQATCNYSKQILGKRYGEPDAQVNEDEAEKERSPTSSHRILSMGAE
jgi:hypothetical protein